MKTSKVKKEQLLEYGMVETGDPIIIMEKVISESQTEDEDSLSIVITMEYNQPELCLKMPDGSSLFLACNTINDLVKFEKCISRWEPNY